MPDSWPTWPFTQLDPKVMAELLKKLRAKEDNEARKRAEEAMF